MTSYDYFLSIHILEGNRSQSKIGFFYEFQFCKRLQVGDPDKREKMPSPNFQRKNLYATKFGAKKPSCYSPSMPGVLIVPRFGTCDRSLSRSGNFSYHPSGKIRVKTAPPPGLFEQVILPR